jgi:hypothetical protein
MIMKIITNPLVLLYSLALVSVIAFSASGAMIQAHMESKTYNKLTGASTTMWDALWVELRVQDQPIGK